MSPLTASIERMANIAPEKNGDLPWWVRLLERHGISTVLVIVAITFVYVHGGSWVRMYISNQKQEREEMSVFLRNQVDATKLLVEQQKLNLQFQEGVNQQHGQQTEKMDVLVQELQKANEMMAPVPELRRQALETLRAIDENTRKE